MYELILHIRFLVQMVYGQLISMSVFFLTEIMSLVFSLQDSLCSVGALETKMVDYRPLI